MSTGASPMGLILFLWVSIAYLNRVVNLESPLSDRDTTLRFPSLNVISSFSVDSTRTVSTTLRTRRSSKVRLAFLEFLQQGGDLSHPHFVHRLGLLRGLDPLQLGLKLLQLQLDAGELEVVLAVVVLR